MTDNISTKLQRIGRLSSSDAELQILRSLHSYRGLLIIAVPRSGSTALELACHSCLKLYGFPRAGEILSRFYYPDVMELQNLVFSEELNSEQENDILRDRCDKYLQCVIRDVLQPLFIVNNINWLKKRFHILLIIRDIEDIYLCFERKKWALDKRRLKDRQDMLITLPDDSLFQRITYDDFIYKPNVLYRILRQWYPHCDEVDYLTAVFIKKRQDTLSFIHSIPMAQLEAQ